MTAVGVDIDQSVLSQWKEILPSRFHTLDLAETTSVSRSHDVLVHLQGDMLPWTIGQPVT